MDGFRVRPVLLAAAAALCSGVPAIAETPAEPPSYQPYYYATSQGASPPAIALDDLPPVASEPAVETYPAETPVYFAPSTPLPPPAPKSSATSNIIAMPSASMPSTVKNLNDELPPNLASARQVSTNVSAGATSAPAMMPMRDQQPVPLPSTVQMTPPLTPMPTSKMLVASADVATPSTPNKVSYGDLPTYQYNPYYDTRTSAFKTPKANDPHAESSDAVGLETQSGFTIGGQISDYRYQEHTDNQNTDFVRMLGPKVGLTLGYTGTLSNNYFITGEVRGAGGENEYHGSGKIRGIPDYILDTRLLGGKDFVFEDAFGDSADFDITPYAGLGFRLLYNQLSVESEGGYDRYSHYLYMPFGVTPRFRVTENSRLSLNVEYDQLLYGWQESDLNDNNYGGPQLVNPQWHGYGIRGSAMWEWKHWGFGPFINYWNIGTSKSNTDCGVAFCIEGDEPENQTLEGGLQVNYKF